MKTKQEKLALISCICQNLTKFFFSFTCFFYVIFMSCIWATNVIRACWVCKRISFRKSGAHKMLGSNMSLGAHMSAHMSSGAHMSDYMCVFLPRDYMGQIRGRGSSWDLLLASYITLGSYALSNVSKMPHFEEENFLKVNFYVVHCKFSHNKTSLKYFKMQRIQ